MENDKFDRRIWSREEFILVMNLYTKIRYGQFNARNPSVISLANLLNRTPGAVAYKLVHFSGLDPYHKNRGLKGLANPGQNAIDIYNEFVTNWDDMLYESEVLLAKYQNKTIESVHISNIDLNILEGKAGIDMERQVKARINQSIFRKVIINNYSSSCAICNLNIETLLVASHILRWSENEKERLNPQNGLCLCSIHDRAFEMGLIGIKNDYKVILSKQLAAIKEDETFNALFKRHDNKSIILPDKFYPNVDFLEHHLSNTFIQ